MEWVVGVGRSDMKPFDPIKHPLRTLFFYSVSTEEQPRLGETIKAALVGISSQRTWTLGPPQYVEFVEPQGANSVDVPLYVVGGELVLFNACRPPPIPRDVDAAEFEEVRDLVRVVAQVSRDLGAEFQWELDGDGIGEIVNGQLDVSLEQGLLGEWARHIESRTLE